MLEDCENICLALIECRSRRLLEIKILAKLLNVNFLTSFTNSTLAYKIKIFLFLVLSILFIIANYKADVNHFNDF